MKKTLYLLFVIGALSSCQSLLDIPQQGVLNMDTFYKTDEDAQQALAAVYNEWAYKFAFSNFHCKLLMADDTWQGGNGPADGASGAALSRAYYDSSNEKIKFMYEGYYIIVNRANLLLDSFQDSADTKIKKQAVAEARFFRAWAYYELVTMWDNPPLVKSVLGSDDGKVSNTPGEETWKFLEDELKDIISSGNLTEKSSATDPQAGVRPTKQTAEALLGKVYMWEGKYDLALQQLESVIGSHLYALATGEEYEDLFSIDSNYSSEYLLSNNSILDAQNGFMFDINAFGCNNDWIFGMNVNEGFMIYDQAKWDAYFGDDHPFCEMPVGWGFFNPTQKLADAFVEVEGKEGYRLNNTIISNDKMHSDVGAWAGTACNLFEHCGWWKIKNISRSKNILFSGGGGYSANFPDIRYAEVLLLAAEAGFKTGSPKALGYFNEIRDRAKAPHAGALDMPTIIKENLLELCFEGHRFQDLKRWDRNGDIDMVAVLKDKGKNNYFFTPLPPSADNPKYTEADRSSFTEPSWVYTVPATENRAGFDAYEKTLPYPQSELDVNPNIKQNPGWESSL